jgi:hypothetical protein
VIRLLILKYICFSSCFASCYLLSFSLTSNDIFVSDELKKVK